MQSCGCELLTLSTHLRKPMPARHVPLQGGPKKWGHRLITIILSTLNRFKKITERFPVKFVLKWILKILLHLAYVATLPCESLTSAKQAINDKLQDRVATY